MINTYHKLYKDEIIFYKDNLTAAHHQDYLIKRKENVMKPYRYDLIVRAMASQGKTNESLAHESKLSHASISAVRNGKPDINLSTLRTVALSLGLQMHELFTPEVANTIAAGRPSHVS